MENTKKIFEIDVYKKVIESVVLVCEKRKDEQEEIYDIVLDQTIFFPEGGGQSPDKGTIDGKQVLDVQIKNGIITHSTCQPVAIGSRVLCKIDWKHRFSNMQQHSGEHIFSGLVHAKYGYNNVGFHLSDQIVTMDFSGPLTDEQVEELEFLVNECIAKDTPIEIKYPSSTELKDLEYRSKIEIEGQVRIVEIPGYDVCACCGTHVKSCGEIGIFKVIGTQNYKGGVRIRMLCGFRALEDYKNKQANVVAISNILSVKQEEISEAVLKIKNDMTLLKQQLNEAKQEMVIQKIMQMPMINENLFLFEKQLEPDVMRAAVNAFTCKYQGTCGFFCGDDKEGYRYIIGSKEKDVREIGTLLRNGFGAKGGGKAEMIQGSVKATQTELEGIFKEWK